MYSSATNMQCRGVSRAALLRERAEEGGARVRIAPLRAEDAGAELVLVGGAHLRAIDLRQGIEPLLVAAARVVVQMFLDRQLHRIGGDVDHVAVVRELNR